MEYAITWKRVLDDTHQSQNPSYFFHDIRIQVNQRNNGRIFSPNAVPKAMMLSKIQQATRTNMTLQQLTQMISTDLWDEQTTSEADLRGTTPETKI